MRGWGCRSVPPTHNRLTERGVRTYRRTRPTSHTRTALRAFAAFTVCLWVLLFVGMATLYALLLLAAEYPVAFETALNYFL